MKVLVISPYHGGSHQAWAEGYQRYSQHEVRLLEMPARFWKWRMHGGAVTLARAFLANEWLPDVIVATDMLDVSTFLSLTRTNVPLVLYMHENQLTYPLPADKRIGAMRRQKGERDLHYAFINYVSALAADHVYFNSAFHRTSFLQALPNFLKHYPDYNELDTIAELEEKSQVLPVGIDLRRLDQPPPSMFNDPPLIVWNQRWEYDKNPAAFFQALYGLQDAGIPFRLALCGQNFRQQPTEFEEGVTRLAEHMVHQGYADFAQYRQLLWEATVTISTAHHEFFGISMLEAMYCHTFPLLPKRLSYPELIPTAWHESVLYEDEAELQTQLQWALTHPRQAREIAGKLAHAIHIYDWQQMAPHYDDCFKACIAP